MKPKIKEKDHEEFYVSGRDGITQSFLSTFTTCRQKARYVFDGWEPLRTSAPLRYGTLVHYTLEKLYTQAKIGRLSKQNTPEKIIKKAIKHKTNHTLKQVRDEFEMEAIHLEASKAEAVLLQYVQYYPEDFRATWIAVEDVFDVEFGGYRLRGKTDGLFTTTRKRTKKEKAVLLETKTSGRISEADLSDRLNFDFQSLFYFTMLGLVPGLIPRGVPLEEVLYNIIRSPGIKLKKGQTEADYIEEITNDIENRPDHYFKRFVLTFPREVLEKFKWELREKLNEFTRWEMKNLATYKNEFACDAKWKCEFLGACARDGQMVGYAKTRKLFRELGMDEADIKGGKTDGSKATASKKKTRKQRTKKTRSRRRV